MTFESDFPILPKIISQITSEYSLCWSVLTFCLCLSLSIRVLSIHFELWYTRKESERRGKMNVSYNKRANIIVILIIAANFSLPHVSESSQECKEWLVQSIPIDMPHLPRVPGVLSTGMFTLYTSLGTTFQLCFVG